MFKNEKGLTLIELLITIAVIAVVAAISVPVVSNVIAASNTNSLSAMQEQVDQFVAEAAQSGTVRLSADGTKLEALIDQNGDGVDEYLVKTFPVDSKYTLSGTGDGPYTVSSNGVSGGTQQTGTTFAVADYGYAYFANDMVWFTELYSVASQSTQQTIQGVTTGTTLIVQIGGVDYTVTAGEAFSGYAFDATMNGLRLTGVSNGMYSHADSTVTSVTIVN